MKKISLFIFVLLLISCDNKSSNKIVYQTESTKTDLINSKFQSNVASKTVHDLFDHNNLDLQMAYLEKKFSLTAMSKTEISSTYEVDNCLLDFELSKKGNIESISIYPTEKCIWEVFDKNKSIPVSFEKIINISVNENSVSTLQVKCPSSCGHLQEPEYTIIFHGASVSGFVATSYTSRNPKGVYEWEEKVKQKLKLENLDDDLAFRENDELYKLANKLFKEGDIYEITLYPKDKIIY